MIYRYLFFFFLALLNIGCDKNDTSLVIQNNQSVISMCNDVLIDDVWLLITNDYIIKNPNYKNVLESTTPIEFFDLKEKTEISPSQVRCHALLSVSYKERVYNSIEVVFDINKSNSNSIKLIYYNFGYE